MRSWFDFFPLGHHADIAASRSTWDATLAIQKMLDEIEPGSAIYCPGSVNVDGTLLLSKSITLQGVPGRETFDNSWEITPGATVFRQRSNNADLFSVQTGVDQRINVMLRDLLGLGRRFVDSRANRENPAATRGRILSVDGGTSGASQVRLVLDNFHACNAAEQGVDLRGNVYGGRARDCQFHANGKQGLRARGGPSIGEWQISGLRLFQNGFRGNDLQEMASFDWQGSQLDIQQMSSSEAAGAGIRASGFLRMNSLQIESCGLAIPPLERQQAVLGDDGERVLSADIQNFVADPGDTYRGAVLILGRGAQNVRISGGINNLLGPEGVDIHRRFGSEDVDLSGLSGLRRIRDESTNYETDLPLYVFARHPGVRHATGDGTVASFVPALIEQRMAAYDPENGLVVAPCNCTLDLSLKLQFQGVESEHRGGTVALEVQEAGKEGWSSESDGGRSWSFNPSNFVSRTDSDARGDLIIREPIRLHAGARARIRYRINGGARTVGLVPAQSFMSFRTWRSRDR